MRVVDFPTLSHAVSHEPFFSNRSIYLCSPPPAIGRQTDRLTDKRPAADSRQRRQWRFAVIALQLPVNSVNDPLKKLPLV